MRTKTSGVFAVEFMGEEIYVGASSQVEIAFRDYMGWIKKNKAPKAIQAVADEQLAQGKELEEIIPMFDYNVVIECEGKEQLKAMKKMYKELGTVDNTPDVEVEQDDAEIQAVVEQLNQPAVEVEEVEELSVTERNELIRERLAEGVKVKEIAEEFGVSKSTVYNVKNGRA